MEKERKNSIFILFFILLVSCNDLRKRDNELIDQYDRKLIEIKGDSALFVSKETVNSFFMKDSYLFEIKDVKINDNVCFFDGKGNIVYQAICRDIKDNLIYLECLDFKTKKEYITYITFTDYGNIKELKKFDVTDVKVFRDK